MEDINYTPDKEIMQMPELSKELKAKLELMKSKIDKFSQTIVKENKEVIGVCLLPPSKINPEDKLTKEEEEALKNKLNILVLMDDDKEKDWYAVREKVMKNVNKTALEIDKDIAPMVMDLYELRENCFDAKYEVIEMIASSSILHDPNDFLAAIKISEVHKKMVLKKFDKYIVSYVAAGSLFRGEAKTFDIDTYIVIDDTDVKKMTRIELRDRLLAIIRGYAQEASRITGVKKQFHIQTYILTDFWDSLKDANPVIYTFLRDGVPLYDRGVFMPWKLLLKMGRIRPSPEAIESQMDIGEKLIQRTKGKMISIMGDDLYYAILNPAQAALMLYGVNPPTPKETIALMDEIFVKKEKLLEKKYVDILIKIRKYYKDIEHGTIKDVSGKEIDELLSGAEDYLKRIKKLFEQIQSRRDKEGIDEMYNNCVAAVKDVLTLNEVKFNAKSNLFGLFKKNLIQDKKIFPKQYFETLKLVLAVKNSKNKKLSTAELEKIKKEVRAFIKSVVEFIQRKRGFEFERAKVRFKYGDKYGEVIILDKLGFIINDLDAQEKEISKAELKSDGSLGSLNKSSLEELEVELAKVKMPSKVFIKEKLFESLRNLFGKDIEILMNY